MKGLGADVISPIEPDWQPDQIASRAIHICQKIVKIWQFVSL